MNRKEIKEKLNNIPKDKYIYQRYKGIITKYIQKEEYYIDCATGISTKIEEHLLLGKISKNLIDLIKKDDYVNGYKAIKLKDGFTNGTMEIVLSNNTIIYRHHSEYIKTILTKEIYMANCYKVGRE